MAESAYNLQWAQLSTRIAPLNGGSGLHVTRCPGLKRAHNSNGTSIGSTMFAQMTVECPILFTMVCLFPPQNCPFPCWHLDLT